jgi:hypothetical protein
MLTLYRLNVCRHADAGSAMGVTVAMEKLLDGV